MAELDLASDWRTLRCQLDDGPAPRAAIEIPSGPEGNELLNNRPDI